MSDSEKPAPLNRLFQLDQAAKKANCTVDDLLRMGAGGDLQLLVGISDEIFLCLQDRHGGIGTPGHMKTPNLLQLTAPTCMSLSVSGRGLLAASPIGYRRKPNGQLTQLSPSDCDADLPLVDSKSVGWKDPRRRWISWAIHPQSKVSELAVEVGAVWVSSTALEQTLSRKLNPQGIEGEFFKSDALQYLNQAARRFWGNVNIVQQDKTTHPKAEQIVEWLVEMGLPRRQAVIGASIIRPEFAAKGRRLEE
jgi:hypothetical protein